MGQCQFTSLPAWCSRRVVSAHGLLVSFHGDFDVVSWVHFAQLVKFSWRDLHIRLMSGFTQSTCTQGDHVKFTFRIVFYFRYGDYELYSCHSNRCRPYEATYKLYASSGSQSKSWQLFLANGCSGFIRILAIQGLLRSLEAVQER